MFDCNKPQTGAPRHSLQRLVERSRFAAMALRFLMSLDRYEFRGGQQHSQNDPKLRDSGGLA